MFEPVVKFVLKDYGYEPTKAYKEDACFDLYIPMEYNKHLEKVSKCGFILDTGVRFDIPRGYYIRVVGRSSSFKKGIIVHEGIIDQGYTGPIRIMFSMINPNDVFKLQSRDRIAQFMLSKVHNERLKQVTKIKNKPRGCNGFGSTGT